MSNIWQINKGEHTGLNLLPFIIHIKCVFMISVCQMNVKVQTGQVNTIIIRCRQTQVQKYHRSSSWKTSYTTLMKLLVLTSMDRCQSLRTDRLIWPSGLSNANEVYNTGSQLVFLQDYTFLHETTQHSMCLLSKSSP